MFSFKNMLKRLSLLSLFSGLLWTQQGFAGIESFDNQQARIYHVSNSWAVAHYTVNGGGQLNVSMSNAGNGEFEYLVSGLQAGDSINYFVTYVDGQGAAYDSAWETYVFNGSVSPTPSPSISPTPSPLPNLGNLIENGDFAQDMNGWTATQVYSVNANGEFQSDVNWTGNPWDWNLSYPLALEGEVEYTLSFRARASVARAIIAGWGMNQNPWAADVATYNLTTEWQTFTYTGSVSFGSFANSRVIFDYGHQTGSVFIDDVQLAPAAEVFVTEDASYTLGPRINEFGQVVETEVLIDLNSSAYLTPRSPNGWIIDNPRPHVSAGLKQNTAVFKGAYVQHCATGEWVNVLNTEYAYTGNPLSLHMNGFDLNLSYNWIIGVSGAPFTFLNDDFVCDIPGHPKQFDLVTLPGVDQDGDGLEDKLSVRVVGNAVFAFVVEHQDAPQTTTFTTEDAIYTVGQHINEFGEQVETEVIYDDINSAYLSPFPDHAGWVIDNPQAAVTGALKMNEVVFKGMYVEHCVSGEWINVLNTEYAYTSDPLSVSASEFSLNHLYNKVIGVSAAPLTFLNEDYICILPDDIGRPSNYVEVTLPGVDNDGDGLEDTATVLAQGNGRFAFVVEHSN